MLKVSWYPHFHPLQTMIFQFHHVVNRDNFFHKQIYAIFVISLHYISAINQIECLFPHICKHRIPTMQIKDYVKCGDQWRCAQASSMLVFLRCLVGIFSEAWTKYSPKLRDHQTKRLPCSNALLPAFIIDLPFHNISSRLTVDHGSREIHARWTMDVIGVDIIQKTEFYSRVM